MRGDTEAGHDGGPGVDGADDATSSGTSDAVGPVERLAARDVHDAVRKAAEPLAIVDRAGRFVFVNDAFQALLGRPGGPDLHGRRWTEFLASGEAARIERESRPHLRSGDAWRGRVRVETPPEGEAGEGLGGPEGPPLEALALSLTPLPEDRVLLAAGPTPDPDTSGGSGASDEEAAPPEGSAGNASGDVGRHAGSRPTAKAPEGDGDGPRVETREPRGPLHDPVTGLAAPALFHELARRCLAAARREGRSGAVLVLEPGVPTGPEATADSGVERRLLQVAARRLLRSLGDADAAGRLPGRGFVVAVDHLDGEAEAVRLGRKLVEALAPPVPMRGSRRRFVSSLGISIPSAPGEGTEELVERASKAAEAGRRSPGSPVRVHRPELGPTVPYRSSLIGQLREALGRYALTLHYQPVLRLDSDEPTGAQALVRWPHPRHGVLNAARFVPLARESGLVRRLDRWVLARAALEADREEGGPVPPISVHLARETWTDPGLAGYLERVMADRAPTAFPLLLHVEADVAGASLEQLRPVVADLRELGAGVAVEGIRADNASTSYLEGLAPDVVCVERSLAAGAAEDETRLGVLRTLIDVGHTLGARVRAEGIERARELSVVRDAGCDEARGYLIGWPAAPGSERDAGFDG